MGLTIGSIDLSDRSKYKYTELDDQPNFEIKIAPACGDSGGFPTVQVFRQLYTVYPLEVMCIGTDEDDAITNRDALLAVIYAANTHASTVLMERTVLDQSTPDVWTVLGGVPTHFRKAWDGLFKIWFKLDLYVFPGQDV